MYGCKQAVLQHTMITCLQKGRQRPRVRQIRHQTTHGDALLQSWHNPRPLGSGIKCSWQLLSGQQLRHEVGGIDLVQPGTILRSMEQRLQGPGRTRGRAGVHPNGVLRKAPRSEC